MEWRLIDTGWCAATYNMALDEALMLCVEEPVLRFYGWEPAALSLGYFQSAAEMEQWRRKGYVVVRRLTGGGAIYHYRELTYCLVLPRGHRIAESTRLAYDVVHGAIVDALRTFGVPAAMRGETPQTPPHQPFCFNRTIFCDIVADGRKIVGSAQRRTQEAFLQHGSIPIERNPLTPEAGYVRRYAPNADYATVRDAIVRSLIRHLGAVFRWSRPSWREQKKAAELQTTKYSAACWTFRR
mgnify:FL=1